MPDPDPTATRQDSRSTTDSPAIRVIIVDDAGDFRHLMRAVLDRATGYVVVGEARNGLEGIAAVRRYDPQLVLLDISMPTMSGIEALPLIREACPDAVIVVLSIFDASALRGKDVSLGGQALALGADGYIQKGQRLNVLLSELHAIVDTNRGDRRG
jgi:DNA-binding NarL/FixJ family response regulator